MFESQLWRTRAQVKKFYRLDALRVDINPLAPVLNRLKSHKPIDEGKDRVIAAHANAIAGLELGATLADDDIARSYLFATELFHAQSLGMTVSPVSAAAATLFVSHSLTLTFHNLVNHQTRISLAMAFSTAITLSGVHLKDVNLGTFFLPQDRCLYLGPFKHRLADLHIFAVGD
jgi:hypothetical protein